MGCFGSFKRGGFGSFKRGCFGFAKGAVLNLKTAPFYRCSLDILITTQCQFKN
jgi:hypothetical protein